MRAFETERPPRQSLGQKILAEAVVREKGQLTVPKQVADIAGLKAGDRVLFVVDEMDPGVVSLYRVLDSYAGVLAGVYGTDEEAIAYVRGEQEAWGE